MFSSFFVHPIGPIGPVQRKKEMKGRQGKEAQFMVVQTKQEQRAQTFEMGARP